MGGDVFLRHSRNSSTTKNVEYMFFRHASENQNVKFSVLRKQLNVYYLERKYPVATKLKRKHNKHD